MNSAAKRTVTVIEDGRQTMDRETASLDWSALLGGHDGVDGQDNIDLPWFEEASQWSLEFQSLQYDGAANKNGCLVYPDPG